ncbi:MAG TPA: FAD-dependent oxidoreductase [Ramlibacter sp.]|nr:FAD-dependent oxidoreductase [Ramlibacter sp.]
MIATQLAIIGAGVAGLRAAASAARAGVSVLVVDRMGAGGQVLNVERIANFPGHPDGISGFELGPLLQEEAEQAGAGFLLDTVESLRPEGADFILQCSGDAVRARAVIVAAGSVLRKLDVPGEERLEGRGVSHCAGCDGPLFRGDRVCVIGGGDSALGEAAVLAQHARQVTLLFRGEAPHAQAYLREALEGLPNVQLVPNADVVEILGDNAVTGVRLRDGRSFEAEGVFAYAGLQADSDFLAGLLERDGAGRIVTDDRMRSSQPGLFAAGDIRAGASYLLADAASEGVQATTAAIDYLKEDRRQA